MSTTKRRAGGTITMAVNSGRPKTSSSYVVGGSDFHFIRENSTSDGRCASALSFFSNDAQKEGVIVHAMDRQENHDFFSSGKSNASVLRLAMQNGET